MLTLPRLRQNIVDLETSCPTYISPARRVDKLSLPEQTAAISALSKIVAKEGYANPESIQELYSFVRYFATIHIKTKPRVLDVLGSVVARSSEHSATLDKETSLALWKLAVYFLAYTIVTLERETETKKKPSSKKAAKKNSAAAKDDAGGAVAAADDDDDILPSDEFDWSPYREASLRALLETLVSKKKEERIWADLGKTWALGVPDEDFLSLYSQVGEAVMERPVKGATRELLLELWAAPTTRFHATVSHSVASTLSHLLREKEHATPVVVDTLVLLTDSYGDDRLARELVLEVGNAVDAGGAGHKHVAGFVEELAKKLPALLLVNLSVILPHLNGEAYQMRCAIIHALGSLVIHLKTGSDKTRDRLLDVLAERAHDVSSYGRGAALQAWCDIAAAQALPLTHVHLATDVAVERLGDKSAIVRKQALVLLTTLVERNPYSDQLGTDVYAAKVAEVQAWLQDKGLDGDGGVDVDANEAAEEDEGSEEDQGPAAMSEDAFDEPSQQPLPAAGEDEDKKALTAKLEFLKYCKSALLFIARVERACADVCDLLLSKTLSDVTGALRFLATAHEFRLPGADAGVRRMLRLVWDSRDSGAVKKELIETFERLYLAKPTADGKKRYALPPTQVAASLVQLAARASLDELTSLEQVVAETMKGEAASVVKRRVLPSAVIDALWAVAEADELPAARAALCVVGMAAQASPAVVDRAPCSAKLLRALGRKDFELARYACVGLLNATAARGGQCGLDGKELGAVHEALVELVQGPQREDERWYPACERAVEVLACTTADPRLVLEQALRRALAAMDRARDDASAASRFFFVAGHVAIKLLVASEQLVSRIKRARAAAGDAKAGKHASEQGEDDLVGATAEDESEDVLLKRIADVELCADPEQLLGMFTPLLLKVVTDAAAPPRLRASAVLCLCKFMAVSEQLCERHIALLLTILRDAEEPSVRANIVIALGDLALRFPNTLEPYTAQVYRPLRDAVVSVRKNTLMVLTHLVLNDMIKIRGEVAEIALRLEDPDARVADLARLFFTELAKRGTNPIYNLLPDVLGGLSREPETVLGPQKFRSVAKYLLAFVDKEKQCEAIADKLCQRIHAAAGFPGEGDVCVPSQLGPALQQCRDLFFCLEHLTCVGEALAKRLADDLFKLYRALLGDKDVWASVKGLGAKAKAAAKSAEAKRLVDDWLAKAEAAHRAQSEEASTVDKAAGKAKGRSKPVAAEAVTEATRNKRVPAPKKKQARKKKTESEDEDDAEENENSRPVAPAPKRSARAGGRARKVVVDDDEEE